DLTGDGKPDIIARQAGTGVLWLYPGNGRGGWLPRTKVGAGWQTMDAIGAAGGLAGDGRAAGLARQAGTGALWLYPGNGRGGWLPRTQVGSGWQIMNAIVGPGDITGDGRADVLARQASTGELWLYPGDGRGGWLPRIKVGVGWQTMDAI